MSQSIDLALKSRKLDIVVREATNVDLARSGLADQYFISAAEKEGRELEVTALQSTLSRAIDIPGWRRLWAEDGKGGFGALLVEPKPWDSEMISVPASNLVLLVVGKDHRAKKELASHLLRAHFSTPRRSHFFVTRIPSDDVPLLHALEDQGFRTIVPMVTLGKRSTRSVEAESLQDIEVSPVRPDEADAVGTISGTAFQWGRFSADPDISRESSERVHRTWAMNCVLGNRAAQVLVARKYGKVIGFIALKFLFAGETKVGSIELIAISHEARGLGIGRELVRAGCNWLAAVAPYIVVRTELPNTAALRMYEGEDFRILNGSLYLSFWQKPESNRI